MKYNIKIKEIGPIRVAFIKYKGEILKANKVFPNVFKAISGKVNGAPFFCYYEINQETGISKMDLCVPTNETPNINGIEVKEIPRIKVVCTNHTGPYKNMKVAYEAIENYARENKLKLKMPCREVFIKGPGMIFKGNPKNYITEILFPIEEEQNDCNRSEKFSQGI